MSENRILTQEQLELEYGLTVGQQPYYRTQLKMPYCKVGKKIFYHRPTINRWILSFSVEEKEE